MADHGEVKIRDLKIQNLIDTYHQAYKNIVETILDDTTAGRINKARTMATIRAQLQELGDNVDTWVSAEIPQYYLDGANVAIQDLKKMGVDLSGPKGLAPINKAAINALVNDTNLAFADSLTAISRNAAALVSDAQKQQMNQIIAEGQLSGDARKTIAANIKQAIEDNGIAALTDKGGRDWAFDTYAEMLVRTKAVESRNLGLQQKMLQNGYDLVQVSDHNSSHPACADWEGQILSVTGNTPGYPTTEEAEADGLMHPNCEHAYNVIDPDLADLTQSYDNPFNYDDTGVNEFDSEKAMQKANQPGLSLLKDQRGSIQLTSADQQIRDRLDARPANLRAIEQSTKNLTDAQRLVLAKGDAGQAGMMTAKAGTRHAVLDPVTHKVRIVTS